MDLPEIIDFNYNRRFGVEVEVNAMDKRDFQLNPLDRKAGEYPNGIHYVADVVMKTLKKPVRVGSWHHTHNNYEDWIIKPDRSCGIEICSPAEKGWMNISNIETVINAIGKDERIPVDDRCAFHVHVNVADSVIFNTVRNTFCSTNTYEGSDKLASIIGFWIKCEPVFMDSVPPSRKRNRYCQCIGLTDLFHCHKNYHVDALIRKLGHHKYFSLNTFHLNARNRSTIEFRITGREACVDGYLAKNWIRLLIHFVDMSRKLSIIPYEKGNRWSSLLWLDPKDVMEVLRFMEPGLPEELKETRNWFLARILTNINSSLPGIWSSSFRRESRKQVLEIISELGYKEEDILLYLKPPKDR